MSGAYSTYLGETGLVGGLSNMTIDGEVYDVVANVAYSPSNRIRETQTGLNRVHGFTEKPRAGFISAQIRDNGSLSVTAVCAKISSTIVLELANGKTVSGQGMWFAGEPSEVDAGEGTFNVRFEGASVTEIVVQ